MTSIKEKLFFAMYQRALVKHKAELHKKNKDTSKKQNPYRLLYGYLEGFEFLPTRKTEVVTPSKLESKSTDFDERDDKRIIQELAEVHFKAYKIYPLHPKYKKTTDHLSPSFTNSFHPDKKVVFVRRIPSVFELSRRVIEEYDNQFTSLLLDSKAFDVPRDFKNWKENRLRKYFATEAKYSFEEAEEVEENEKQNNEV